MKHLLFSSLLLISVFTDLKTQDLPADSILYNSLVDFYKRQMEAELKVYQVKTKYKWAKYMPTVGVTYTVNGHPRPSLSYNPLSIIRAKEEEQLRELSAEAVVIKYKVLIDEKLIELENLILDYRIDLERGKYDEELQQIDSTLMVITEEKYKQNLIKPSVYLADRKKLIGLSKSLLLRSIEMRKKQNRIFELAKYRRPGL